ncbi:hypothetical protein Tco_1069223 [Tanacetum coccineum]|uniref:Reverse transcriptase domain-containing protein n=1 Tax=Tanacetum coccineum TaxID=301880 RepID=A0ABQ5HJC0_9ASTR
MKEITTRSGVAYEGPSIPTNPSPKKVVEREDEETTDKEQTNFQGSTAHIPPSVNPIPISEPGVSKTLPKPNIPYPSRFLELYFILKKSNHFSSGSTNLFSDSRPSLTSFETSDSLLAEFADKLALLDPFPPENEDVDFKADLREIEWLLNHDPSTNFSPTIIIDPYPRRGSMVTPALVCYSSNHGDDKSFLKEDVQEENFQVYSNPLFEFDDNYNSNDINPLFNEILEDVESKDF